MLAQKRALKSRAAAGFEMLQNRRVFIFCNFENEITIVTMSQGAFTPSRTRPWAAPVWPKDTDDLTFAGEGAPAPQLKCGCATPETQVHVLRKSEGWGRGGVGSDVDQALRVILMLIKCGNH